MAKLTHVIATDDHYMSDGSLFAIRGKKYEVDKEVEDGFYIQSEHISAPVHYFSSSGLKEYFIPVYEDEKWSPKAKPPLGVMPEWLYEESRIRDLCRALYDYSKDSVELHSAEIMKSWADELSRRLHSYCNQSY